MNPLIYVFCLIILYELEENIILPSTVRMLEDAICQQYFYRKGGDGNVPERSCKIEPIQQKLALIRGYLGLFKNIPGILLGAYFGKLADKLGRRPIYALNMAGMIFEVLSTYLICHYWRVFQIEWVWLTSISQAFGGGVFIILALHMTILSELSLEHDRSQIIYKAFALKYGADLIGPQIASIALRQSLWLPNLICIIILAVSFPIVYLLPETRPKVDLNTALYADDWSSYTNLLRHHKVWICIIITFLTQYRYLQVEVFVPYTSVRFQWEISEVSRLLSIVSGISLVIFLLLPSLHTVLQKTLRMDTSQINLLTVRSALLSLTVGGALMAIAAKFPIFITGFCIFAVGNGVRASLLAVASMYTNGPAQTNGLYTLLSLTDGLSHMLGAPFIQGVWSRSLELDKAWLVLPFCVTLVLFTISFVLSLLLQGNAHEYESDEDATERLLSDESADSVHPVEMVSMATNKWNPLFERVCF